MKLWPKSRWSEENIQSRQNILRPLAIFSISLAVLTSLVMFADYFREGSKTYDGMSPFIGLALLVLFLLIYYLNRRGFSRLASSGLLAIYFILNSYFAYTWGVELPTAIVFYIMLVVMTAVLLGSRSGWIMAGAAAASLIIGGALEDSQILTPDISWRGQIADAADQIPLVLAIAIIMTVCALYNRQIKKSLNRAWKSEDLLRQERDLLEVKVEERTKELKKAELEKMTQLYRLVEFGRLAAGIFHDLVNPLTAVSLNLEQIKENQSENLEKNKKYLNQAVKATEKMGAFVGALKKQLKQQETKIKFSVNEEIRQIISLLNYQLIKAGLNCDFKADRDYQLSGDPLKFSQIILNLLTNAIDAYENLPQPREKITIKLGRQDDYLILLVKDRGQGIAPENQNKIFEPFFSTKPERGLGIGLAAVKSILEKDFKGSLQCVSQYGFGTKFNVRLPISHE